MDFSEKLQQLRINSNLTQEQLAEKLFVSRVTISKWESGRGYPNIESLKLIAKTFNISIDELLSNEQLISIAERQNTSTKKNFCSLVFGFLDFLVLLLFILPIFGNRTENYIYSVSLLKLTVVNLYVKIFFYIYVCVITLFGVAQLTFQNSQNSKWNKMKFVISLFLSVFGILIFIVTLQPYSAIYLIMLLCVKIGMLLKVSRM